MRTERVPIMKLRLPDEFELREHDEDFVELLYRGVVIATFASRGVDPANIQKAIQSTAEAYISVPDSSK